MAVMLAYLALLAHPLCLAACWLWARRRPPKLAPHGRAHLCISTMLLALAAAPYFGVYLPEVTAVTLAAWFATLLLVADDLLR